MNNAVETLHEDNGFRQVEVVELSNYPVQVPLGIEFVRYPQILQFNGVQSHLSPEQRERLRYLNSEMMSLCDTEDGKNSLRLYQNTLISITGFLDRFRGNLYIAYNLEDYRQIIGIGNATVFNNPGVDESLRPACELGYLVMPEYQGQNLGTTIAASCLLDAFDNLRYKTAFYRVLNYNNSSNSVLSRLRNACHTIGVQGGQIPSDSIVRRSIRGVIPAENLYQFSRTRNQ